MAKYVLGQKLSFWLVNLYFLFEYLRPQSMYPQINIIPFIPLLLILWLFAIIIEGKIFSVKNAANKGISILFIIVLLSSALAFSPYTAFSNIKDFILLILIYYLIIYTISDEKQYFILIFFYLLINFKLSHFAFIKWVGRGLEYDKYGAFVGLAWLRNPGEFAIQMCIAFAISTYFILGIWPNLNWVKKAFLFCIPVTCFGSIMASGSRGSFLGIAVVLLGIWIFSKKKIFGVFFLSGILVTLPFVMSERDIKRFENIGSESDVTGANRLERWEKGLEMLRAYPVFGVGYRNWGEADRKMFNGTGALSHNIFIECSSELGLAGLFVFLYLIFITFKNNRETRRIFFKISHKHHNIYYNLAKSLDLSLLAYLVTGFFVTIFYYPFFWINLALTVSLNNIAKKEEKKEEI